jgi:hypothetical protein
MNYNKHTLANGSTIVTFSNHQFKFSDGTVAQPQNKEFCDFFTIQKNFVVDREIKGMKLTKLVSTLTKNQLDLLAEVSKSCDIVLVPFQLLETINKYNRKDEFMNIVSFNSTPDTARSSPQDKVVDISNWSILW